MICEISFMNIQQPIKDKTLVIGASTNESRYSNLAIKRLKLFHHEIRAFGLREGMVDGIPIIKEATIFEDVDTVTLYVGPDNQSAYYQYVIDLKPRRVIFNPGTENPDFYKLLDEAGIEHFEACTLVMLNTGQY